MKTYKRVKQEFFNVPMFVLGQDRIIPRVELIYEVDTKKWILSFDELHRIEQEEHARIMRGHKERRKKREANRHVNS